MKARVIWERLRSSYWFLPTVMSIAAIGLSFGCLALDGHLRYKVLQEQGWVYGGGPQGARAVLATLAGSIITVAGTTFSVTIAVLSMASTQFGPRLVRNFMRDRANQVVLGIFMATFLYSLLVLRAVRGTDDDRYVPHLSVTVGVGLAIVSLGALIFFIHHVAESIQISNMIATVGGELDDAICRLFPTTREEAGQEQRRPRDHSAPVLAKSTGYLQDVDLDTLLQIGGRLQGVLYLKTRPGDYVIAGMPLLEAETASDLTEQDEAAIRASFTVGLQRTPDQDAEFAFLQLAELAVRALSPGINDPYTATMCVDRIAGALCLLADRSLPSAYRLDQEKELRVVAQPYSYRQLVEASFSQIRQYGKSQPMVVKHLRTQIGIVLLRARDAAFRMALEAEMKLLPAAEPALLMAPRDSAEGDPLAQG